MAKSISTLLSIFTLIFCLSSSVSFAQSTVVYSPTNQRIITSNDAETPHPIASITKLMTAEVLTRHKPDLMQRITVTGSDVVRASTTYLRRGDQITLIDALHLMLIGSDNVAARIIARTVGTTPQDFVVEMNSAAQSLDMHTATFVDPSGLFNANRASALDVAKLIHSVTQVPIINDVMHKKTYTFRVTRRRKSQVVSVRSTNRLLRTTDLPVIGKTGFIRAAKYCFAALFSPFDKENLIVVVLGAPTSTTRFNLVRNLYERQVNE